MPVLIPELLYRAGRFEAGLALEYDEAEGTIVRIAPADELTDGAAASRTGTRNGGDSSSSARAASGGGSAADETGTRGGTAAAVERLSGRALLPGFVNAHSHAFQRLIRGRTQWRPVSVPDADFWSWREAMYGTALALSPEDIFHVSRFCFLEMLRAGITAVGEFHYLHRDRHGRPYTNPSELAHRVIAAAADVGIRIALLNVCYATGDIGGRLLPEQRRFATPDLEHYLVNTQALLDAYAPRGARSGRANPVARSPREAASAADRARALAAEETRNGASPADQPAQDAPTPGPDRLVTVGVAPHSVRAVPRAWLRELHAWATERDVAFHMHVSEQTREVEACLEAYGARPVQMLAEEGVVDDRLTAVHATHLTSREVALLGDGGATVCACPTTERDLGDGFLPGAALLEAGVNIALGSDSHTVIHPLEETRLIEYHERLRQRRRVVLAARGRADRLEVAPLLLDLATQAGTHALRLDAGRLEPGRFADFVAIDLGHPALAGWTDDSLAAMLTFSAPPDVVADVWIDGVRRLGGRRHILDDEAAAAFRQVAAQVG